jgi:polyhydroxyalkanoate synthesis regulator phasin
MVQSNVLKRYLDAGVAFTSITQAKAEALVKDLVKTGEMQTEQAQAAVADLVERGRKNTEALLEQVFAEIAERADSLGLATRAELSRVEKLIESVGPTKKAPAKKSAAKKAPAKKSAAKKTPAKKAPAKKSAAKKTAAKRTAAKKTAS